MATEKLRCCGNFLENSKHHFAMIALQFGYAGMNIISKVSLNRGMSHYVLVVYRHAFATVAIAPFVFIFERKSQPKITFRIFMQIFILALLGPVIDQNFYYAGLKLTSPTFACALSNVLPAMTFVMAILCRMEKLNMKKVRCQAKVLGTVLTVAGAMLMAIYKGPIVEMLWTKHANAYASKSDQNNTSISSSNKDWLLGSFFLIIAALAWSFLFVLQAKVIETYKNHQLSLTTLICFIGTLQAIVVTFVMEHKTSVWTIGWDMNLLAAAYSGIISSSLAYYVQGWVIKTKGPVFATAFTPLMMIIAAIMGSFILSEQIFLGGVIGAILIAIGLYSVLWGKHKEQVENKVSQDHITLPVQCSNTSQLHANPEGTLSTHQCDESKSNHKEDLNNNLSSLVISIKANQEANA